MKEKERSKKLKMSKRARKVLKKLEKGEIVDIKEMLKCPYCDALTRTLLIQ